jgi:hypothetical protein
MKWDLMGHALPARTFYYTEPWRAALSQLSRPLRPRLDRPLSPRGRVAGLVEQFVAGDRRVMLITPQGNGMEPPFKRLRAPHEAVVEMRTTTTRTFGFFSARDTYVALFLAEVSTLKTYRPAVGSRKDPYHDFAAKVETFLSRLTPTEIDRTTNVEELISDS